MNPELLAASEQALAQGDGATAERLLRALIERYGDQCQLRARLGRSLLLQGAYSEAEAELLPLARSPSTSFWTLHKLGDALWGQRRLKQAAHWYGQAVARGGVASALTVANHLTLLDLIDPRLAVAWLDQRWHVDPDAGSAWVQGAQQASQASGAPSLQIWLESRGLAVAAQPSAGQPAAVQPLRISPDYRRHWQQTSRGLGVVGYLAEGQRALALVIELPAGCCLAIDHGPAVRLLAASATSAGLCLELRRQPGDGALLLNPIPVAAGAGQARDPWSLMLWLAPAEREVPNEPCLWLRAIPVPAQAETLEAAWLNRADAAFNVDPFWEQVLDAQLWQLVNDHSHQGLIDLHTAAQRRHESWSNAARIRLALLIQQRAAQLRGAAGVLPTRPGPAARFVMYWDRPDRVPVPLQDCITALFSEFPASRMLSDAALEPDRLDFGARPLVRRAFHEAPHPALRSDLLRLGFHYRDHGWLDPDVRCSPCFAALADQLLGQCCAQGISVVPLLKPPNALWGSPTSCLGAYPINGMLVLAPGFRQRLLDRLEVDLDGACGGRLIDGISGPGLLSRCLWSTEAGRYRLDGFLTIDPEPLPIWLNALGERFVMPGFDTMGLSSLAPEDKYNNPHQDWRNLTTQQLDAFLADLAHHATTP